MNGAVGHRRSVQGRATHADPWSHHPAGAGQVRGRRPGGRRPARRARSRSRWSPRACATPTTTSPPATSRSAIYPFAGGHEGAGIVTKVGREHQGAQGGRPRRLLLPARPAGTAAGARRACRTCATSAPALLAGLALGRPDRLPAAAGRRRQPVGQMCGISTFCETTTVSARLRGEDPRRHPAGQGLPGRLRRRHRLGLGGQLRRGPARATP